MKRWNTYRTYLMRCYGGSVYRIGVDGGFSCPNRRSDGSGGCAYCDATGSKAAYLRPEESGAGFSFDESISERVLLYRLPLAERLASIKAQVARGRAFVARRYKAEMYSIYFQAWTNTYAPVAQLKLLYDTALDALPESRELIVSTRPDEIDEEKAELLASYQGRVKKVWVELGLQSANDGTLCRINRGHDVACYERACDLLHAKGVSVSTHIILGLPGEGLEDYLHTARVVASVGSEALKIHNLDITGGTALYDDFMEGEVSAPSMVRHLENTVEVLRHIPSDVVIQRLVAETPRHRLAAPRDFGEKNLFLSKLQQRMERLDAWQGDLYHPMESL